MKVPGQKQKIRLRDREVWAIEQQFEIAREDWNEYKLLDGGTVRLKTTIHRILRIVDEDSNQIYNEQDEPQIIVRHRSDIVTSV